MLTPGQEAWDLLIFCSPHKGWKYLNMNEAATPTVRWVNKQAGGFKYHLQGGGCSQVKRYSTFFYMAISEYSDCSLIPSYKLEMNVK